MSRHIMLFTLAIAAVLIVHHAAEARVKSAKDQALYEKARKDCNSPKWPNGARIVINYAGGWYRCEPPNGSRR